MIFSKSMNKLSIFPLDSDGSNTTTTFSMNENTKSYENKDTTLWKHPKHQKLREYLQEVSLKALLSSPFPRHQHLETQTFT